MRAFVRPSVFRVVDGRLVFSRLGAAQYGAREAEPFESPSAMISGLAGYPEFVGLAFLPKPTPQPICSHCGVGAGAHLYDCPLVVDRRNGSTPCATPCLPWRPKS
jgi:hypothetical protein